MWDHLHGRPASSPSGDVDVVWFDPARAHPAVDREIEATLRTLDPSVPWSVKNQARMHLRNGDPPYRSTADARHWPETATSVAIRRTHHDACEIAAPHGPADLFALTLKPTPSFTAAAKRPFYGARIREKRWLEAWPLLRTV